MDIDIVITKAQEQLQLAMEAQHQENSLQHWTEMAVKAWVMEFGRMVVSDKEVVEEASKLVVERVAGKKMAAKAVAAAVERIQNKQIQMSNFWLLQFSLEVNSVV